MASTGRRAGRPRAEPRQLASELRCAEVSVALEAGSPRALVMAHPPTGFGGSPPVRHGARRVPLCARSPRFVHGGRSTVCPPCGVGLGWWLGGRPSGAGRGCAAARRAPARFQRGRSAPAVSVPGGTRPCVTRRAAWACRQRLPGVAPQQLFRLPVLRRGCACLLRPGRSAPLVPDRPPPSDAVAPAGLIDCQFEGRRLRLEAALGRDCGARFERAALPLPSRPARRPVRPRNACRSMEPVHFGLSRPPGGCLCAIAWLVPRPWGCL